MERSFSHNGRSQECLNFFLSKPRGNIPILRPRRRLWENNIAMDPKGISSYAMLLWRQYGRIHEDL